MKLLLIGLQTSNNILLKDEQFEQRYQILKVDSEKGLAERLLTYLWLWQGRTLMAKPYPESARLYDYPQSFLRTCLFRNIPAGTTSWCQQVYCLKPVRSVLRRNPAR